MRALATKLSSVESPRVLRTTTDRESAELRGNVSRTRFLLESPLPPFFCSSFSSSSRWLNSLKTAARHKKWRSVTRARNSSKRTGRRREKKKKTERKRRRASLSPFLSSPSLGSILRSLRLSKLENRERIVRFRVARPPSDDGNERERETTIAETESTLGDEFVKRCRRIRNSMAAEAIVAPTRRRTSGERPPIPDIRL